MKPFSKDPIVLTNPLYQTTDYSKFKTLKGNRAIDKKHVRLLRTKIEREGNLTQYFPIQVNEEFEVIDGQHRLRALEELNQPVYYEVKEGMNIDSIIQLNTGQRGWNWYDYAMSFAERGNIEYANFLQLHEEYPRIRFQVLYQYATNEKFKKYFKSRNESMNFYEGDLIISDLGLTRKLLTQYAELAMIADLNNNEFAISCYRFMRTPTYNHAKMLDKLHMYGSALANCRVVSDFLFTMEDIWRR